MRVELPQTMSSFSRPGKAWSACSCLPMAEFDSGPLAAPRGILRAALLALPLWALIIWAVT